MDLSRPRSSTLPRQGKRSNPVEGARPGTSGGYPGRNFLNLHFEGKYTKFQAVCVSSLSCCLSGLHTVVSRSSSLSSRSPSTRPRLTPGNALRRGAWSCRSLATNPARRHCRPQGGLCRSGPSLVHVGTRGPRPLPVARPAEPPAGPFRGAFSARPAGRPGSSRARRRPPQPWAPWGRRVGWETGRRSRC